MFSLIKAKIIANIYFTKKRMACTNIVTYLTRFLEGKGCTGRELYRYCNTVPGLRIWAAFMSWKFLLL